MHDQGLPITACCLTHDVQQHPGMFYIVCTGAIKDSIVSEEALVEHLLWELAQQPRLTCKASSYCTVPLLSL